MRNHHSHSYRIFFPYGDLLESLKQTLFFSLVFSFILSALIQRLPASLEQLSNKFQSLSDPLT